MSLIHSADVLGKQRESPHGVKGNVPDCSLEVSKLKLQSRYYVHFRTNTIEKSMNSFIPAG